MVEQEKSTLAEKLSNVQQDLKGSNLEYDRLKREALAKQEQDHQKDDQNFGGTNEQ